MIAMGPSRSADMNSRACRSRCTCVACSSRDRRIRESSEITMMARMLNAGNPDSLRAFEDVGDGGVDEHQGNGGEAEGGLGWRPGLRLEPMLMMLPPPHARMCCNTACVRERGAVGSGPSSGPTPPLGFQRRCKRPSATE